MSFHDNLSIWLLIWILSITVIIIGQTLSKMPTVNLSLSYVFSFSINHFFGALIYIFPWYSKPDYDYVRLGFIHSTYGIVAFSIANVTVVPFIVKYVAPDWFRKPPSEPNEKLPIVYIVLGGLLYFMLSPV